LSLSIPTRQLSTASVNKCTADTRLSPEVGELMGSSKKGPQWCSWWCLLRGRSVTRANPVGVEKKISKNV